MKTRIRTKEYNNGKVEYICEVDIFKRIAAGCFRYSCFFIIIPLLYFMDGRWQIIERKLPLGMDIDGEMSKNFTKGVFSTLDAAKQFIDGYIKEEQDKKALAHGKEIKKETFEKYP